VKAHLLAYNPVLAPERVHQILNNTQAVKTWLSPFPYAAVVLSELTVNELAAVLQTHFLGIWFILVEANRDNANGWLPPQFWEYISDPGTAWSKQLFASLFKNIPPPPLSPPPLGLLGDWKKLK
jgi:hypothetical protein